MELYLSSQDFHTVPYTYTLFYTSFYKVQKPKTTSFILLLHLQFYIVPHSPEVHNCSFIPDSRVSSEKRSTFELSKKYTLHREKYMDLIFRKEYWLKNIFKIFPFMYLHINNDNGLFHNKY